MARGPRIVVPGYPHHVISRGNNRQTIFARLSDHSFYKKLLAEAAAKYACSIHAYALMTNHTHLLITPDTAQGLSKLNQSVGRRYVQYFNKRSSRTGTLFEGRFKSCVVASDEYLLCCYRYVELNPVRAKIVEQPEEYLSSSYRCNAFGEPDLLVTPHAIYSEFGDEPEAARDNYRNFVKRSDDETHVDEIRRSTQTDQPFGGDDFREEIERLTGRRAGPLKRGRPYSENRGIDAIDRMSD